MNLRGRTQSRVTGVLVLLVVLHFGLRPWLGDPRVAPDFLLLALLIYSIRTTPGRASIAGFLVGLLADALTPSAFGAAALAHTVVGYLSAWAKAVFFAENLVVSAAFFAGGTWLRDLLVLLAGGQAGAGAFGGQIAFWSLLKALTTAGVGVAILATFRRWLDVRIVE